MYLAKPLTFTLQFCPPPSVYLRWLSPLGEWCGWLFAGDIDTKTHVTDATDMRTADARVPVAVRRPATDSLLMRAGDLSEAQHQALSTILNSPQVYRQWPNGARQPVLITTNSLSRTSTEGRHELELEIKLPARNALTH